MLHVVRSKQVIKIDVASSICLWPYAAERFSGSWMKILETDKTTLFSLTQSSFLKYYVFIYKISYLQVKLVFMCVKYCFNF